MLQSGGARAERNSLTQHAVASMKTSSGPCKICCPSQVFLGRQSVGPMTCAEVAIKAGGSQETCENAARDLRDTCCSGSCDSAESSACHLCDRGETLNKDEEVDLHGSETTCSSVNEKVKTGEIPCSH